MPPTDHQHHVRETGILVASPSKSRQDQLLVLRRHARGALLPAMRQGATAGAGRLLHILWIAVQAQPRHRDPGARILRLSRHLHPDINAISSAQEQDWSLEQSSQLNDAYRTLKDPVTRTEYLLRLQGVRSRGAVDRRRPKKHGARAGAKKQVVPPDLLEQVFELNMQLEEARMNKKLGEPDRTLELELRTPRSGCRRSTTA